MALRTSKFAAATAIAAAFSLLATPVAARDHHGRWHHGNDIDAGDVIAGVAILGVIAAIAGAGKNNRDRYEERYPLPDEDAGYHTQGRYEQRDSLPGEDAGYDTRGDYERSDSRGIDRAVDMCVGEVERGEARVDSVDSASRSAEGWRVSGELDGGAPYSCTIGNDGQIFVGDPGQASASPDDGQSNDDGRYETARAPDFE